ncbi:MAG: hypothetical protein EXQ99_06855 [Alphaproteobacteria bacterium]|nr:hypothetical protein [Alphaproteobacteria bacterium]
MSQAMIKAEDGNGAFDGGVSSDLALVIGPEGPYVVKQARSQLNVAADWRSDPRRAMIEVAALEVMAEALGADCVPRVLCAIPCSTASRWRWYRRASAIGRTS